MADVIILAQSVQTILFEIAKQTEVLGSGLQNAAPGGKKDTPPSIQYLFEISDHLKKQAIACGEFSSDSHRSA